MGAKPVRGDSLVGRIRWSTTPLFISACIIATFLLTPHQSKYTKALEQALFLRNAFPDGEDIYESESLLDDDAPVLHFMIGDSSTGTTSYFVIGLNTLLANLRLDDLGQVAVASNDLDFGHYRHANMRGLSLPDPVTLAYINEIWRLADQRLAVTMDTLNMVAFDSTPLSQVAAITFAEALQYLDANPHNHFYIAHEHVLHDTVFAIGFGFNPYIDEAIDEQAGLPIDEDGSLVLPKAMEQYHAIVSEEARTADELADVLEIPPPLAAAIINAKPVASKDDDTDSNSNDIVFVVLYGNQVPNDKAHGHVSMANYTLQRGAFHTGLKTDDPEEYTLTFPAFHSYANKHFHFEVGFKSNRHPANTLASQLNRGIRALEVRPRYEFGYSDPREEEPEQSNPTPLIDTSVGVIALDRPPRYNFPELYDVAQEHLDMPLSQLVNYLDGRADEPSAIELGGLSIRGRSSVILLSLISLGFMGTLLSSLYPRQCRHDLLRSEKYCVPVHAPYNYALAWCGVVTASCAVVVIATWLYVGPMWGIVQAVLMAGGSGLAIYAVQDIYRDIRSQQ